MFFSGALFGSFTPFSSLFIEFEFKLGGVFKMLTLEGRPLAFEFAKLFIVVARLALIMFALLKCTFLA
jgi:hypothetical protein